MRERCRAKATDNGKWIYGTGLTDFLNVYPNKTGHLYMWSDYGWVEIDPTTVGWCVGVKDENDIEIYERDIVQCNNGHIGVVEWESHDCCFNVSGYYSGRNDFPTMAFIEGQPFTILGNMPDNPELLLEPTE